MTKKKQSKRNAASADQLPGQEKKQSYPKQMTIRYGFEDEQAIQDMMNKMGEKTMTKAFLRAPEMLTRAHEKVKSFEILVEKQMAELDELRAIVEQWKNFNTMLEKWVEK